MNVHYDCRRDKMGRDLPLPRNASSLTCRTIDGIWPEGFRVAIGSYRRAYRARRWENESVAPAVAAMTPAYSSAWTIAEAFWCPMRRWRCTNGTGPLIAIPGWNVF